jgi:hypothetical protein
MQYLNKTNTELVKILLEKHPHLRDNDNKLLANIWYIRSEKLDEGAMDFLNTIAEGKLPSSESIRRVRQKLQELNPKLRGKLYNKRHKMQTQVKQELHEIENEETVSWFKENTTLFE